MAYPVTLNGRTYTLADFEGTNYVEGLPDAFEDFVTHAGDIYNDVSTTSNSIGTGSKTFTVSSGKPYQAGTPLRIADAAAPATNFLDAVVTSYSGTTLVVEVVGYAGSGTKTSWTVNIGGAKTADGTLGVSQGGTGATTASSARDNLGLGTSDSPTFAGLTVTGATSFSDISISDVGDIAVDSVSGDADADTKITFAGSDVMNLEAGGSTIQSVTTSGIGITGNITVSGTVDDRDVATDGTKLDGIEASADVTDTANVTAAGALMDSELTDIDAIKALDQGVATTDTPTFAGIDSTEARPTVRPSLMLDFANSKTLDPRISFSRGSTATYWDGKSRSLGEQNFLLYSEDLTNVWTIAQATVTANQETAPDGTTTADQLDLDNNELARAQQPFTGNGETTAYTFSVYIKADSAVTLRFGDASNFSDISVTTSWQRFTHTQDSASPNLTIRNESSAGAKTIYVWGAQVELGSNVTAYTKTTADQVLVYQPTLQTAASAEARFDHDSKTGESKGLLIEPERTNLEDYSEFSNGWGSNGVSFFRPYAISPDGTRSAAMIEVTSVASVQGVYASNQYTVVGSSHYTASVFIRKELNSSLAVDFTFYYRDSIGAGTIYGSLAMNTATGFDSYSQAGGTNGTYKVQDLGDWWRISITSPDIPAGGIRANIRMNNAAVGKRIIAWGFQVEKGVNPSSYIPTNGSTVTRSADTASITGSDFTSAIPMGSVFSAYTEATSEYKLDNRIWTLSNGGASSDRILANFQDSWQMLMQTGSSTFVQIDAGSLTEEVFSKISYRMDTNNSAVSIDGSSVVTDTSTGRLPILDALYIGSNYNGSLNQLMGTIKKLAFYPEALSDATLKAMTEE